MARHHHHTVEELLNLALNMAAKMDAIVITARFWDPHSKGKYRIGTIHSSHLPKGELSEMVIAMMSQVREEWNDAGEKK